MVSCYPQKFNHDNITVQNYKCTNPQCSGYPQNFKLSKLNTLTEPVKMALTYSSKVMLIRQVLCIMMLITS